MSIMSRGLVSLNWKVVELLSSNRKILVCKGPCISCQTHVELSLILRWVIPYSITEEFS